MITWTREDSLAAIQEGWDVWDCDGSDNGPWQICAFDDPELASADLGIAIPELGDDQVAWMIVRRGFTPHALKAQAFLFMRNRQEYNLVMGVRK